MTRRAVALGNVRLLVLDVDGVLTDGRLYYDATGEVLKVFHVRDGYGIKAVQRAGIQVAVISGRGSPALTRRCAELGIAEQLQNAGDNATALALLCAKLDVPFRACAYVGDDLPDAPAMKQVGLAVAVADAHAEVRRIAHRCTRLPGGAGAVREVCEWLLAARRAPGRA
jgi:3-deoxy-D-manno-octulosonate 8-phosphate phosphatase (KDO 8-P phosphatase)